MPGDTCLKTLVTADWGTVFWNMMLSVLNGGNGKGVDSLIHALAVFMRLRNDSISL